MDSKQTFDHLRNLATIKCDQDIECARLTLKERLSHIDQMESELASITPTPVIRRDTRRRRKGETKCLIERVIPADQPFTIEDVMALLAKEIDNAPHIGSVRQIIRGMKRCGELKEVVNKRSRLQKLYALPGVAGDEVFPLIKTVVEVLDQANAPMRPVEICVWLIEHNRAIEGDPSAAVGHVLRTLREHPDRFIEVDTGHWRLKRK